MMRTLAHILLLVAMFGACESTPKPKEAPVSKPASTTALVLNSGELVRTAQLLRDREFEVAPKIEATSRFDSTVPDGCEGRCDEERRWLTRVLFAQKPPIVPVPIARFDAARAVVEWDAKVADESVVQAAVLAELVKALDALAPEKSESWDAHLTATALREGAGVFVASLDQARKRAPQIDASRLAMRPETLYSLEFGDARFKDGFATREGFAFVAAMIRAGGWSAVELAHNERPTRSQQIVRPDRYLSGDAAGEWQLSPETAAARATAGYELALDGTVGPALFVEWLSRHVPAAVARAGYIGFESDRYRLYTHADGRWAFEWVSLWNLPSTAEQVVEALDAGLRTRADGAAFTVLRKGATVAVVGESSAGADLAVIGTALVEALPVFRPSPPRGVDFVQTPVDRIQSRPQVSSIPPAAWHDLATGLSVDLGALGEPWELLPTTEPNLPWFAKHPSGAVLQYLVEPVSLFDPPFDDTAYADGVRDRFSGTVVSKDPATVKRADRPVAGTLLIDATGQIKDRSADGPVRLRAWHFAHGPFISTLSLQAPPEVFETLQESLSRLVDSIDAGSLAAPVSKGVIHFSVDE